MIRNLLYSCCPFTWNDEWRLNVESLGRFADVFNGQRLVIVRQGPGLAPLSEVRTAFPFEAEFVSLPNDPVLHETSGFIEMLGRLASQSLNETTFYAHTKGASRRDAPGIKLEAIRWWRDTMYRECLSDPEKIDRVLATSACCGCFRVRNTGRDLRPSWYFSGNFWWVKHSRLFSRESWPSITETRNGVERYLGQHFTVAESHCLYEDSPVYNQYTHVPL